MSTCGQHRTIQPKARKKSSGRKVKVLFAVLPFFWPYFVGSFGKALRGASLGGTGGCSLDSIRGVTNFRLSAVTSKDISRNQVFCYSL